MQVLFHDTVESFVNAGKYGICSDKIDSCKHNSDKNRDREIDKIFFGWMFQLFDSFQTIIDKFHHGFFFLSIKKKFDTIFVPKFKGFSSRNELLNQ